MERIELNDTVLGAVTGGACGTGAGMAAWAENAVGWNYVWGGSGPSGVDCSGLICGYAYGCPRTSEAMFATAPVKGPISSMPELPGLGLYMPGHVGVYLGGGMAVDARNEDAGVCRGSISSLPWTQWFEIPGISYGK